MSGLPAVALGGLVLLAATGRRTLSWAPLAWFALAGAFLAFLAPPAPGPEIPASEAVLRGLALLALLAGPTVLVMASGAGTGATLYDGMALGAALGLGFEAVRQAAAPGPWLSPEGPLPALVWATTAGLAAAGWRRARWGPLLPRLGVLLLWAVLAAEAGGARPGLPDPLWPAGWILVAFLLLAWLPEDHWLLLALPRMPALRLPGEPDQPGASSELALLLRSGRALPVVARFLAARRRWAVADRDRRLLQARHPGRAWQCDRAEEVAVAAAARARAALEGRPAERREEPPAGSLLRRFALALLGAVLFTAAGLYLMQWMGVHLTGYLAGNVWGLPLGVGLAAGLPFPLLWFLPEVSEWVSSR